MEEVQSLFLVPPQLDPILSKLHVDVPISSELFKSLEHHVVEDEKLILLALQGRGYLVENGLAFFPFEESKLLVLLGTQPV